MGSDRGVGAPTMIVAAAPMQVRTLPTDVLVVPFTRNERGALVGLKTTSYAENVVALAAAIAVECSEAILANTRGELCEGTGSNVVVGLDGRLVTPPLASGCLAGVTRALMIDAAAAAGEPIVEAAVQMSDLERVSEAFLLSTGRHVQPIRRFGDRVLPACPGPLTQRAATVWHAAYDDAIDP